MILGGSVLMLAAILVVFTSESAARGHLGVNALMGLRFGYVMVSDEAWLAGHRAARILLDVGGCILFLTGVLVMTLPWPDETMGAMVLVSAVVVVFLIVIGGVIANRAARTVVLQIGDDEVR